MHTFKDYEQLLKSAINRLTSAVKSGTPAPTALPSIIMDMAPDADAAAIQLLTANDFLPNRFLHDTGGYSLRSSMTRVIMARLHCDMTKIIEAGDIK